MTTFVHVDMPAQHPGVARFERVAQWAQPAFTARAVLALLAAIGRPVVSVLASLRQAREDARFLEAARFDARLMADISRAMDAEARAYVAEQR